MDVVRNMARDPIFSAEEREILTIALEDTEEWLSGEGNEILKSDCESQLDLLHVVCDPYITRHREAIEAKVWPTANTQPQITILLLLNVNFSGEQKCLVEVHC